MANDATLRKLFVEELRDTYHSEKQLTKALPKLAKAATSPDLRSAFESHLEETHGHVERLEEVFDLLGETPKTKRCAGMAGIIEEGSDLIQKEKKGPVLDAGLIAGAQRAEHYEIAAYGSLVAWAQALNEDKVIDRLELTLGEEKAADEKLSSLACDGINSEAASGDEDEEEDENEENSLAAPGMSKSPGARARTTRGDR